MGYTIRCGGHTYITLEYDNMHIMCYDNDCIYAEDIILKIEKRTGMKFRDIDIIGKKEDFTGLRFFNGGWRRDFWNEFPTDNELLSYRKMKEGVK